MTTTTRTPHQQPQALRLPKCFVSCAIVPLKFSIPQSPSSTIFWSAVSWYLQKIFGKVNFFLKFNLIHVSRVESQTPNHSTVTGCLYVKSQLSSFNSQLLRRPCFYVYIIARLWLRRPSRQRLVVLVPSRLVWLALAPLSYCPLGEF